MTYEKEKLTIHLEGSEVDDFWNIIMYALDYNNIAIHSKKGEYTPLTDSQVHLAEQIEEASRPQYG